jgi:hopene-associated glycosyltransferase HpnB
VVYLGAAASVAALAWLYLVLGHGGFWRTTVRLPAVEPGDPPRWPEVVAVVPARDEADILPETLPTLLGQRYPGPFRVVLVDDGSSDGTAEVAAKIAAATGAGAADTAAADTGAADTGAADAGAAGGGAAGAAGLRVIGASPRPDGWAGKVWAMAEGVRAAGEARYLLFTDADIAYAPGTLTTLVRAAIGDRRDLLSQMALLRAWTGWERAVVPAFVYFFAQLYPFRRVSRPGRTAAAAGGCMLVRRAALEAAGGLAGIRGALIDDVALARLLKRQAPGTRCWLGLATGVVSRRAYPRLGDLWDMVARSAYTQLRYSPLLLAGTVAGLLLLYALPPAALVAGLAALAAGAGTAAPAGWAAAWAGAAGAAGWALMAGSYLPMLRYYRVSALRAPALPAIAMLYAAMTADSAFRHWRGRGGTWKGRAAPGGRL